MEYYSIESFKICKYISHSPVQCRVPGPSVSSRVVYPWHTVGTVQKHNITSDQIRSDQREQEMKNNRKITNHSRHCKHFCVTLDARR